MCASCSHTIHRRRHHFAWDNTIPPVVRVAPGETVLFECQDAAAGQFTSSSTSGDVEALDFSRVNPITGPVHVDGAEPGDALKLTFEAFEPSGLGWTANIPGFGLLADQFPDAVLNLWTYDSRLKTPALFSSIAKVPLKPFAGEIGVAPFVDGPHSVIPPRRVGGNIDIRDLSAGSTLYLPVEVGGALLSIGDTHAAQGEGEVCGTAIESAMDVAVRIELEKGMNLQTPRFITSGPVNRHLDEKGYTVTTGIGPDLLANARVAVSEMIEALVRTHGLNAVDAYMLCSVCADLHISEIVNAPHSVVTLYFPNIVFE